MTLVYGRGVTAQGETWCLPILCNSRESVVLWAKFIIRYGGVPTVTEYGEITVIPVD